MNGHVRYVLILAYCFLISSTAFAQLPYRESFRNSTAPGITFGGAPSAILTAAPGTAPGGGSIDPEGQGYLRLTGNTTYQKGYIISNAEFPARNGLKVIFEYYVYGGTGADGISLFLYDALASPFNIGGFGGSLGYAQITNTSPISPGVSKGYIAVGLDEFGNFSNPTQGRQGGPGFMPGSITLRGRGNGAGLTPDNYPYLTSQQTQSLGFPLVAGGSNRESDSTSAGYRRVYMDLAPNPAGGYNVTVRVMRGGPTPITTTVIDNFYYREAAPANLRYGIASSTGERTNYHEIRNVFIDVYKRDELNKPAVGNDIISVCAGKEAVIDVTANDKATNEGGVINKASIDLDPATAGIQSSYSVSGKGTFSFSSDGNVLFTPEASFTGPVVGYYTVNDSYGVTSDPAVITVTYTPAPAQPDAGPDQLIHTLNATASYIMKGSSPSSGSTGRWSQVSGANTATFSNPAVQNSLVSNLAGGAYTFRWTVTTTAGCELFDDVVLTVNHTPVAKNDTTTTALNTFIEIPVWANDTDPDGDNTLDRTSVTIKANPAHGTVLVDPATGLVRYRPSDGFSGYDSFVYTIKDNYGAESTQATVLIAVNVKPAGTPDIGWTTTETPVILTVLPNDSGRAGASVIKNTDPANGVITVNPEGTISYTPAAGFSGKDTFTYKLRNKEGLESDPILVTVNVRPVGSPDNRSAYLNTPVTISVKDNDISKTGTSVVPNTLPLHGSITVNADNTVTYTPASGYSGTDSFTYRLRTADGLESDPITVNLTISGIPPKIDDIIVEVPSDQPSTIQIPVPPGGTIVVTNPPKHGTFDPNTGIYTPNPGYTGPDDFDYVIRDENGNETPGRVIIEVSRPAKIGLAKGLTAMTKNPDGTYNITFVFTVVNYGDHRITQLSLTDDLAGAFPSASVTVRSISASGDLRVNDSYNGITDKELLLPSSYIRERWKETVTLDLIVSIGDKDATFYNTSRVTGTAGNNGSSVSDQSTNGLTPDPVTSGDPSPSELTPVKLVKQPLFIPGGFSPNGDGINDYFIVENASGKQVSLEVYNRWGNRVYRSKNYQNDWNGKCTEGIHYGEDVPVGTYYFVISIQNEEKRVGYVTINR